MSGASSFWTLEWNIWRVMSDADFRRLNISKNCVGEELPYERSELDFIFSNIFAIDRRRSILLGALRMPLELENSTVNVIYCPYFGTITVSSCFSKSRSLRSDLICLLID